MAETIVFNERFDSVYEHKVLTQDFVSAHVVGTKISWEEPLPRTDEENILRAFRRR